MKNMCIRVQETKTRERHTKRFTTVNQPGKVLYVFVFDQGDFERNLNLHSSLNPFGDRCQNQSGHIQTPSTGKHVSER